MARRLAMAVARTEDLVSAAGVKGRATRGDTDPKRGKADAPTPPSAPAPAPWQTPRPLPGRDLLPVPRFDPRLLPLELRDWVADAAQRMQVPIDIVAVAAMCALGTLVANARTIHPMRNDPWRVHTNMWGVVIAPPGSKKSPAIAVPNRMLARIEQGERERHQQEEFRRKAAEMMGKARDVDRKARVKAAAIGEVGAQLTIDGLAEELRAEAEQAQCDKLRRLLTTDATIEKLGDLVANGNRRCTPMIVWCDELAGLLATFHRDGHEGDRAFYNAAWSVQHHTVDRMTRGSLFLKNLCLSIFGAMTPEPFEKYVRESTAGDGADGFLQRFQMMVYPDPTKEWELVDRNADQVADARARALFDRVFALVGDDEHGYPRALNFDTNAQQLFYTWLGELEARLKNPGNKLSEARISHLAKYRQLLPAIALVCHIASRPGAEDEPVSWDAAERARAWCAYLDAHADRIYALAGDNGYIEGEIVRRIEKGKATKGKPSGSIKVRDLHRSLPGDPKIDRVQAACEQLEEHGWLRLEEVQPKIGRPHWIAHINPLAIQVTATPSSGAAGATS